jgi:hypothetical protein
MRELFFLENIIMKENNNLKIYRTKRQETAFRRKNRDEEKPAANNKRTSQSIIYSIHVHNIKNKYTDRKEI